MTDPAPYIDPEYLDPEVAVDPWNLKDRPRPEPTATERVFFAHQVGSEEIPEGAAWDGMILVKRTTPPQALAVSIRGYVLQELKMPMVRAIGVGAVNQACKGIAVARGYLAPHGVDLACNIGFENVIGFDGSEISAMTFRMFMR